MITHQSHSAPYRQTQAVNNNTIELHTSELNETTHRLLSSSSQPHWQSCLTWFDLVLHAVNYQANPTAHYTNSKRPLLNTHDNTGSCTLSVVVWKPPLAKRQGLHFLFWFVVNTNRVSNELSSVPLRVSLVWLALYFASQRDLFGRAQWRRQSPRCAFQLHGRAPGTCRQKRGLCVAVFFYRHHGWC